MKNIIQALFLISFLVILSCGNPKRSGAPKVLVFTKTMGFEHASIPAGKAAIQKLANAHGFEIDTTSNAAYFEEDSLKTYSAVIFLSTTGDVLDHKQEAAFERYIQAGGGYVGIHAASDTEYDWNWYGKLVGGYFLSHPNGTPEASFTIEDKNFGATDFFIDSKWKRVDELYNFKKLNPKVNVLMTVDESTYKGGENGDHHPMSWYHDYDGGRAFYTALGHTDESYEEELFLKHVLGGIQYAIGENRELDYSKAISQIPPDTDRFAKKSLASGMFFEPTEMTILPDNDVLIAQRRGELMLYKAETNKVTQVGALDVYYKTLETPGVNAEEGFMGLQKDPDFENNHWIYVYYSPAGDKWVNRLSRFKFEKDTFDKESEQLILEVDSQREICCHTGGSIAFGPDGLLYLSTGDNSTPFNERKAKYVNNGYAPLNDIPGRQQYDARRSSANTNDLRGKILRIKVKEDGSYSIPEGNLFPEGTAKTRPEIYTMGHRNPYRISVDPKNGYLYWGDIGPDARGDSLATRGPMGYDEMNQAREAGNFGWPLFIGDNFPYVAYDYSTGKSGAPFNADKPINDSKNNTGLRELPKAMPAYVYYPYGPSGAFPQVGSGGRNAMAGPVYYSDMYPNNKNVPDYYDGKVIIYEWMRGWMKAVSLFPDGTFNKMEPFAADIKVSNLMDVEMGPDGRMYLLEYGSGWFQKNDDSGLSYIEFNGGNRPPVVQSLNVNQTSGALPLKVTASVEAMDREKNDINYVWDLGNGKTKETTKPSIEYTYDTAGEYKLSVAVKDSEGAAASSEVVAVVAGNARPKVDIKITGGNSSFFVPGTPINYKVSVEDPDAGTAIVPENIYVSVAYLESTDQVEMSLGHQQVSAAVTGKSLTQGMDCKACHKENGKSVAPSYMEISERYKDNPNSISYLQKKIVEGGSGVWGEVMMAAHPNITPNESRQIALYIQSLTANKVPSLPAEGQLMPTPRQGTNVMVLSASYTDQGQGDAVPLTGSTSVSLQSSTVPFSSNTKVEGFTAVKFNGMDLLLVPPTPGWFALEDIDLTGVSTAIIAAGWQEAPKVPIDFEMRLNAPDGKLLGKGTLQPPPPGVPGGAIVIPMQEKFKGKTKAIYIVHVPREGISRDGIVALMNVSFK